MHKLVGSITPSGLFGRDKFVCLFTARIDCFSLFFFKVNKAVQYSISNTQSRRGN
jgi:hypothetical protein